MFIFSLKKIFLGVVVALAILLSAGIVAAQSNNCDAILNSAGNHSVDWKNWDSLIGRLNSKGCDYTDINIEVFSNWASREVGDEFEITTVVTTLGPVSADNFTFQVSYPSELTLIGGTFIFGDADIVSFCFPVNHEVNCTINSLPADGQLTLIQPAVGNIQNRPATTVASLTEPSDNEIDPRNNSDSVTVLIE